MLVDHIRAMDIGHQTERDGAEGGGRAVGRKEVPIIDGKLNGRMDGGLTPERPLNSNLFYHPLSTGPANFNIRTDATALTR